MFLGGVRPTRPKHFNGGFFAGRVAFFRVISPAFSGYGRGGHSVEGRGPFFDHDHTCRVLSRKVAYPTGETDARSATLMQAVIGDSFRSWRLCFTSDVQRASQPA
jgi:hypothetical protein